MDANEGKFNFQSSLPSNFDAVSSLLLPQKASFFVSESDRHGARHLGTKRTGKVWG